MFYRLIALYAVSAFAFSVASCSTVPSQCASQTGSALAGCEITQGAATGSSLLSTVAADVTAIAQPLTTLVSLGTSIYESVKGVVSGATAAPVAGATAAPTN